VPKEKAPGCTRPRAFSPDAGLGKKGFARQAALSVSSS